MAAVIRGWLDDSRRDHVWVVGGYVGGWHRWEDFEANWPMALANHEVPYFHMKEMAKPTGPFAKWLPPQDHREELADFFGDLAKVIGRSRLVGICSLVRLRDLERFNSEFGQCLEPYPLAAYGCMILTARDNLPSTTIDLVFDHVEQIESKLARARVYADSDPYNAGDCDKVVSTGLPKGITSRELPAMQAADFFAWEYRKNHENNNEYWELPDRPENRDDGWAHFEQWSMQKYGSAVPTTRKSAIALMDGNEFYALIWD